MRLRDVRKIEWLLFIIIITCILGWYFGIIEEAKAVKYFGSTITLAGIISLASRELEETE